MLQGGYDINYVPKHGNLVGCSTLWLSMYHGDWELAKKLIAANADLGIQPPKDSELSKFTLIILNNFLTEAIKNSELDLVQKLKANGAELKHLSGSESFYAIVDGIQMIFMMLLLLALNLLLVRHAQVKVR